MDTHERIDCQSFFKGVVIEVTIATELTSEDLISLRDKRKELVQRMAELVSGLLKKEESGQKPD